MPRTSALRTATGFSDRTSILQKGKKLSPPPVFPLPSLAGIKVGKISAGYEKTKQLDFESMEYKYRAIIFDFDDTLVDNKTEGIDFHQTVARSRGWRVPSAEEIEKYWGLPWQEFINKLWPKVPYREFHDAYVAYNREYPRHYKAIPGTIEALDKLKKMGFALAILSNRNKRNILDKLEDLGFKTEVFTIIYGEEELIYTKPDPRAFDPLFTAFGKLGIVPAEIIYVGDTQYDIKASRRCGIKFVGVLSGLMDRTEYKAAGIDAADVIPAVKDLPKWLCTFGKFN